MTDEYVKDGTPEVADALPTSLLMFVAHRYVQQRILAHLADHGFDITLAQARLAARIDEGGSRLTRLAEAAEVTKQSAGFLVDQLERAGYVERVPDPTDARARLVRLAPRGLALRECAREMEAQVEADFAAHLGEQRMRQLREALEMLREVTDPYA